MMRSNTRLFMHIWLATGLTLKSASEGDAENPRDDTDFFDCTDRREISCLLNLDLSLETVPAPSNEI